jgi:alginate O-acetyltransferase complex protein AlgJ
LKERGIELIVMPAPSKPMIQPEKLSSRFSSDQGALQNASYRAFCDALRREGIRLFDPSDALIEAKRQTEQPQFLQTDTHWTPEAMGRVAGALAQYIRSQKLLPDADAVDYRRTSETVENLGDIALMLKLPLHQTLYSSQRVRIHPVQSPNGESWKPRKDADVLLLGDSYSNIYSLDGMGWGKSAGFAEQLSYDLKRPLDRIVINDGGSYTTREQLLRENARGKDRLKGKRLVIWEFAMRDLIEGDWKRLDLPSASMAPRPSFGEGKSR